MLRLRDSRRLPGPNLLHARPGAVLDVTGPEAEVETLLALWEEEARRLLEAVGWTDEETAVRRFRRGASLFLTAPIDALYVATEVNDQAFAAAKARVEGGEAPPFDEAVTRLRDAMLAEANPPLLRLHDEARARSLLFLSDRKRCSVGMGVGSRRWFVDEIPELEDIPWERLHDVPVAVVTGTNGKSTTVRLTATMLRAAGLVPGTCSTDGVLVGDDWLERGDFSGPEGARRVLRDAYVEAAVLETARGGLLRRGLGVPRADVAAVLNVAEDHLGEFGIGTLEELVEVKLALRRAVADGGRFVINLDDENLAAWRERNRTRVDGFTRDPEVAVRIAAGAFGDAGAWQEGDDLVLWRDGRRTVVARVPEVPVTLGGAATYNIANALAAMLIASGLGVEAEHIREGLLVFASDPATNPGRLDVLELDGVHLLVDYAHNPHGLKALLETAARIEKQRMLVLLGQAGDRDDEAIRDLSRVVWAYGPDRVIVKELPTLLRGRERGEIPDLIEDELRVVGAPEDAVVRCEGEIASVEHALAWARPGDLLLLLLHAERGAVLELLEARGAQRV